MELGEVTGATEVNQEVGWCGGVVGEEPGLWQWGRKGSGLPHFPGAPLSILRLASRVGGWGGQGALTHLLELF